MTRNRRWADRVYDEPQAQASYVAFRRDVYARRETAPWVNHGAPSYWTQESIRRAGHRVVPQAEQELLHLLSNRLSDGQGAQA
jgi:hypothetical protein